MPIATSMFDDDGFMRCTPKSIIKSEMAVERSARGLDFGAQVIDGCTHIRVVPYPTAAKATVQTYVDAVHASLQQLLRILDVCAIYDR